MQLTSILTCFEMISKTQISFKNFRVCSLFFWSEFFFRKISPNFEFSKKKPIFFCWIRVKTCNGQFQISTFWFFDLGRSDRLKNKKILRKKSKHSKKSNILHCLMFTVVSAPFFFRWNINLIKTHFLCALYKRVHINWGDTWFFSNGIKHTQHKSHFMWRIQRKRTATQERKQIKLRILNTATGSTSIGQRVWAKKWPIQQQIRKKPWCWGGGFYPIIFHTTWKSGSNS